MRARHRFDAAARWEAAWRASAWVGALVLPLVMVGMIDASITRSPSIRRVRRRRLVFQT
jgi:hypothetical protein